MEAAPTPPVELPDDSRADRPMWVTQRMSEATRRRQVSMSRWENEGGSVAAPEHRS